MRISGFQKLTLLDYPGHISALIFTTGCNMRCPFCYNAEMVLPEKIAAYKHFIEEKEVLKVLQTRKDFLEGVVISGGEPTLQPDLRNFIIKIKGLGLKVKLDTNGLRPSILEKLFKERLLDFVAMDIKASLEKYTEVANVPIDTKKIQKSIGLIMESGIDYEFRSTIIPKFHSAQEMEKMARLIAGARHYALQRFMPVHTLDPAMATEKPYSESEIKMFATIAQKHVKKIELRG
ncbi:anaerobic ribonucleoside-triphosphate reductase activating protein [Candidatus Peregrinibacteria bacterium]|nr:anaerobic ribonucleoside-triphosphate reductase activating protein [Candidatus Peregrinibacteria bacterium]